MATMKDVAQLARVSTATVSHVINGTKKLSAETTERVLMAIQNADYTPNSLAKSLRSGQTKTIGVLVEDIRGLPVADIVAGIGETIGKSGYRMLLFDLHLLEKLYDQYEQISAYRMRINNGVSLLLQAHVDGIIYVGMHDRYLDGLFGSRDRPTVFAHSHGTGQDTFVTYSNQESAAELTRYLIAHGHRRIAVIAGQSHSYPTMRRLSGYQKALKEAGIGVDMQLIRYGDWEYDSGFKLTKDILALSERPTAIFAMNDPMAAGCIHALNEAGLFIPKDMAVVGFDDREMAQYLRPPLTTVAMPTQEIGTRAALYMMELIADPKTEPKKEIIRCSIVERMSV